MIQGALRLRHVRQVREYLPRRSSIRVSQRFQVELGALLECCASGAAHAFKHPWAFIELAPYGQGKMNLLLGITKCLNGEIIVLGAGGALSAIDWIEMLDLLDSPPKEGDTDA